MSGTIDTAVGASSISTPTSSVGERTPGRWHFNRHVAGQYSGDLTSDLGRKDGIGQIRTIAVLLKYAGKDQCEANARLITASPDGLDFAQRAIAYLQDYLSECECASGHDEEYVNVLRDAVERGELFIAKATGAAQ